MTRLNGRAADRAQEHFHWRVQTRLNAQERTGDVVIWFWPVLGSCIP